MRRDPDLQDRDPYSHDLVVEFTMQAEVGAATRIKYWTHLRAFTIWLLGAGRRAGDHGVLLAADTADVQRFMAHLRAAALENSSRSALSPSTRKNYLASLRSFYRFCVAVGLVETDPTVMVRTPRVVTTPGLYLSASEIRRLLDAPGTPRERIQTYLLVFTAARSGELRALRWDDIDLHGRTMRLTGKGGRSRTIDIHPLLMVELRRWHVHQDHEAEGNASVRAARADPSTDFVLITSRGRPVQTSTIYRQLKRRACEVGLHPLEPGKHEHRSLVSPHALRRSFATQLLNKGLPIDAVADVLGHASLDTTRRHYAFSDDERRRMTIEAFTA
jgi:integrase/recombinase XerC